MSFLSWITFGIYQSPDKATRMSNVANAHCKCLPVFDSDLCTGCNNCIEACPKDCIEMEWSFAKLTHPEKCSSEGACAEACTAEGIKMSWVHMNGDQTVGRWRAPVDS